MTEADWLACTDPQKMLEFLGRNTSRRKLRLFAAAACRPAWPRLDPRNRKAIEVAERLADEAATRPEREEAYAGRKWKNDRSLDDTAVMCTHPIARIAAREAASSAILLLAVIESGVHHAKDFGRSQARMAERVSDLLRDVVGNPFRPITISPTVLTWNEATVVRLAQAAYDERHLPEATLDSRRLAVLADALEEAGCTSENILDHLRGSGPHVRGCWPVDLCLDKS